ncbi:hypothetical protein DV738_g3260, partial [Chaetothyriales sp. CBS 135597]
MSLLSTLLRLGFGSGDQFQYQQNPLAHQQQRYHKAHPATDVFRVAVLLRRLGLPDDVIPCILDHADYTYRVTGSECTEHFHLGYHQSGRIYTAARLKTNVVPASLRAIHFTTISKDQDFSWDTSNHGTYNGSWTWFEAGLLHDNRLNGEFNFLPSTRIDGKTICINVHAERRYRTHTTTWRITDDDDFIQKVFQGVKDGKPVAVTICARFRAWVNNVKFARIEFDLQPVRKV